FDRDGMVGAVAAGQIAALLEVPEAEFELLLRRPQERFELAKTQTGLTGMGHAPAVQQPDDFLAALNFVDHGRTWRRNGFVLHHPATCTAVLVLIGGAAPRVA